jgi:predicted branched-subunit amino acid permease
MPSCTRITAESWVGFAMGSTHRALPQDVRRSIAVLCAADALVGAAFGAHAVGSGLPSWLPVLLSIVVFAGAAQFLFVGVVATGGGLAAAVLAGLLVNLRLLPLGFAAGPVLGEGRARRLLGNHLVTDETVALALAQPDTAQRRATYWASASAFFVCWNVGVVVGAVGGGAVAAPETLGLDAAFPAVLLALVVPSLREPRVRRAALSGAGVALATAPFLPAGLPVLVAAAITVPLASLRGQPAADSEDPLS